MRIELYGSDGRLMARKILVYDAASQAELDVRIDFEISHASEAAWLMVRTEDAYGRVQALNSVEVVLLAQGEPSIKPAPLEPEGITIASPEAGAVSTGGTVTVTGAANIPAGRPLNVQLITREGRVLAFNEVYPTFKEGQTSGTFEISLPYRVKEVTWVQIAISEGEGLIPVPIHFAGVEVQLAP